MGRPPISASILPGSRVEAARAGTITMKPAILVCGAGRGGSGLGSGCLTVSLLWRWFCGSIARAAVLGMSRCCRCAVILAERARFFPEHNGYAVSDGVGQLVVLTDQFLLTLVMAQGAVAQRADEELEKMRVHSKCDVIG